MAWEPAWTRASGLAHSLPDQPTAYRLPAEGRNRRTSLRVARATTGDLKGMSQDAGHSCLPRSGRCCVLGARDSLGQRVRAPVANALELRALDDRLAAIGDFEIAAARDALVLAGTAQPRHRTLSVRADLPLEDRAVARRVLPF